MLTKSSSSDRIQQKKMSDGDEKDDELLKDLIKSLFPDDDYYCDGGETVANLNREMSEMLQRRVQNMRESLAASVRGNPEIESIVNDVMERELNDVLSSNLLEEIPDPNDRIQQKKMSDGDEKDDELLKDLIKSLFPDDDYYCDGGETVANLNREMSEMLQRRVQNMRESLAASVRGNPEIESIVNDVMERELNDVLSSNLLEEIPDPNRSKLSSEKRAEIKRLVDAGASLSRVDALHLAASYYKQHDLFDLLIDEYGLGIEDPDNDPLLSSPLMVAAFCGNCEAVEILLAKGADKKYTNSEGRTALQEVKHANSQRPSGMPEVMFEQLRRNRNVDRVTNILS